jgi:hypothetical protein
LAQPTITRTPECEEQMTTPFGSRLIGETEKTLNALLDRFLDGTGLDERQWVTLRLAALLHGSVDAAGLAAAVTDRAHFSDAAELVHQLVDRGLLRDGRLTPAGHELTGAVQDTITNQTAPIWEDLPDDDVAATTRTLNEVVTRARRLLAEPRP